MIEIGTILTKAGGYQAVAQRATMRGGRRITPWAVQKWTVRGIPGWHVPLIAEMSGVPERDILAANRALLCPRPTQRGNGKRNRNEPRASAA